MRVTKFETKWMPFLSDVFALVIGIIVYGGRLFEFKWEWEGGRVGWALFRGLALIRG